MHRTFSHIFVLLCAYSTARSRKKPLIRAKRKDCGGTHKTKGEKRSRVPEAVEIDGSADRDDLMAKVRDVAKVDMIATEEKRRGAEEKKRQEEEETKRKDDKKRKREEEEAEKAKVRDEKRQKKQVRDQESAAERAAKPPKRSRHWLDFENRAAQPPALPTVVANNSFAAVTSGPNCRDVLRGYLKAQEIPAENTDSLKRFIGTFHDHMKVQARASNRKVGEEVVREFKRLVSRTMPPSKVTFVEAACAFDLQKNGPLGDAGT